MKIAGYEIIKKEVYRHAETYDRGIILGIHPSEKCPARYATWEYTEQHQSHSKDGKVQIDAFWGHYYQNETEAYKDYYTRLADNYNLPWEG